MVLTGHIKLYIAAYRSGCSSTAVYQNPKNHYDVNDDGFISPADALAVINALNNGERQVGFFYDVSGDRRLSPVDALYIINKLNQM